MIYTSYWGNMKKLQKAGIEPVAISRGKPKWFTGRFFDGLAPTWKMLKMSDEDYDREYELVLGKNDPDAFVEWLGDKDVALLCWERNPEDCHRKTVAEWLRGYGYEVMEFGTEPKRDEETQMTLF